MEWSAISLQLLSVTDNNEGLDFSGVCLFSNLKLVKKPKIMDQTLELSMNRGALVTQNQAAVPGFGDV